MQKVHGTALNVNIAIKDLTFQTIYTEGIVKNLQQFSYWLRFRWKRLLFSLEESLIASRCGTNDRISKITPGLTFIQGSAYTTRMQVT